MYILSWCCYMEKSPEYCQVSTNSKIRKSLSDLMGKVLKDNEYCEDSIRKTQIQGDKKIGTITQYAQLHGITAGNLSCISDENEKQVVNNQRQILYALIKDNPDVIFLEWVSWGKVSESTMEYIRVVFDDWLYDRYEKELWEEELLRFYYATSRDELRNKILYQNGWGLIYGILYNKAIVWAEDENSLDKAIDARKKQSAIESNNPSSCEDYFRMENNWVAQPKEVYSPREKFVLTQIKLLIEDNPWIKIAITYWAAHNFSSEYFKVFWSKWPVLERVDFPKSMIWFIEIPKEKRMIKNGKPIMKPKIEKKD